MQRANRTALMCLIVFSLATALAIGGCAPSGPTFVDNGTSYSKSTAIKLLADTDTSKLTKRPTRDADTLRHAALTSLRRRGTAAATAADLLIKTLPTSAHGVPVYVEIGSYEATPATILVEAIGPATGTLSTKRLWAIGKDGTVLFVATR